MKHKSINLLLFSLLTISEALYSAPNVIVIVTDDLGYADVSFTHELFMPDPADHPKEVSTPNIDSVAHESTIFSNGYVSGNVCSPTRAGLMMGRYQQRVSVYDAGAGGKGYPTLKHDAAGNVEKINHMIPHWLKQEGDDAPEYISGAFGKWHLGLDEVYKAIGNKDRAPVMYDTGELQEGKFPSAGLYGNPTNGFFADSKEGKGSPWHAMNRGFDHAFLFMGRGAHDFWDPNGVYTDFKKSGALDPRKNPDDSISVNPNKWDSKYKIHPERTPANYMTPRLTDAACEFIEKNAGGDRPFFCYLAYNAPHSPLQAPYHMSKDGTLEPMGTKNGDRYNTKSPDWYPDPIWYYENFTDMELPAYAAIKKESEHDGLRRKRAITLSMVHWVDRGIGQLIETLKKQGIYDDTMIFFISDNGGASAMIASNKPLNKHKHSHFEGGVRVPFFVKWPKSMNLKPSVNSTPVIALDILPTILDVVGGAQPTGIYSTDGKSIVPVAKGKADKLHDYIYWSEGSKSGAVRNHDWKLYVAGSDFQLYNLEDDLGETKNVAGEHPEITQRLKEKYIAWLKDMAASAGEEPRLPAMKGQPQAKAKNMSKEDVKAAKREANRIANMKRREAERSKEKGDSQDEE